MIHYIIPARAGSKGFPGKNRILLKEVYIPKNCIVYTDDLEIKEYCRRFGISYADRPKEVSEDITSTKETVKRFIKDYKIPSDDIVVLLYLTYPERTASDIYKCLEFFEKTKAKSLLCKKPVTISPFLTLMKKGDFGGQQLVPHDYYRRQDYPECFEISHFVSIFLAGEVESLNSNLYNKDTVFYPIEEKVDVDHLTDYEHYKNHR